MSRVHLVKPGHKYCSSCKGGFSEEAFVRKGKTWKTCNTCSAGRTGKRHAEALRGMTGYDDLQQHMAGFQITPQEYSELLMEQTAFRQQQQQQFDQYWRQQRDPRSTLDFFLADPTDYVQSPVERFIQHRQRQRQPQQVASTANLSHSGQLSVDLEQPLLESFPELLSALAREPNSEMEQSFVQGMDQGRLQDYGILDLDSYSEVRTAINESQVNYSRIGYSPTIQLSQSVIGDFDFEADFRALLRTGMNQPAFEEIDFDADFKALLHGSEEPIKESNTYQFDFGNNSWSEANFGRRTDSMIQGQQDIRVFPSEYHDDASVLMDVSMGSVSEPQMFPFSEAYPVHQAAVPQSHVPAAAKRIREPPFTLEAFFTDFNPSDDVLRQPPPQHDLTGEHLVKHHIRELGLAIRLSLLPSRWYRMPHNDWLRTVQFLDRLEETEQITAWGPLSDWLVSFQNGMEDILETHPSETPVDYQTAYKLRGARAALFNKLRVGLRVELQRLFAFHKQELVKLFTEFTAQTEHKVKIALTKQVCLMKNAILQDCAVNDILYLPRST